jgi:hypothetical protein
MAATYFFFLPLPLAFFFAMLSPQYAAVLQRAHERPTRGSARNPRSHYVVPDSRIH